MGSMSRAKVRTLVALAAMAAVFGLTGAACVKGPPLGSGSATTSAGVAVPLPVAER